MYIKDRLWFFLHNNRRNRFVSRFAKFCKNIHRASEHPGYDVNINGEKQVLTRCCEMIDAPVIFDVGANVGDWSLMAHFIMPRAQIHAFELNPKTGGKLSSNCSSISKISVHSYGLGSEAGTASFYCYDGAASELCSLRAAIHNHEPHTIETTFIRTGDQVCKEYNITRIDFLKIDAEGSDFEVLQGFKDMLRSQRVSVIQFEHQGGRYLKDFYNFFEPLGYSIGKLYATYVDFRKHDAQMEDLLGPNYIAVLKNKHQLMNTLKTGWPWQLS